MHTYGEPWTNTAYTFTTIAELKHKAMDKFIDERPADARPTLINMRDQLLKLGVRSKKARPTSEATALGIVDHIFAVHQYVKIVNKEFDQFRGYAGQLDSTGVSVEHNLKNMFEVLKVELIRISKVVNDECKASLWSKEKKWQPLTTISATKSVPAIKKIATALGIHVLEAHMMVQAKLGSVSQQRDDSKSGVKRALQINKDNVDNDGANNSNDDGGEEGQAIVIPDDNQRQVRPRPTPAPASGAADGSDMLI